MEFIKNNWYWLIMAVVCGIPLLGMLLEDVRDFLEEYWGVVLGIILLVGVGVGITCGFLYWKWWAMLLILGGLAVIAGTTVLVVWLIRRHERRGYDTPAEGYEACTVVLLKQECAARGIKGYSRLTKQELIDVLTADDAGEIKKEDDGTEKPPRNATPPPVKKPTPASNAAMIPKIRLADIAGLDEAKNALEERVILPLRHPELFAKYGKQTGGGILLFGLPGTGKTMFAQAVATELNATFFSVKCSDIQSKWYGEAENNVKKLFTNARKCERAVIFFDEFDALGKRRTESNEDQTTVQEILTQMQGVERSDTMLLVIAATNAPWSIDGALLRPGRFNERIYIPLPDTAARLFILRKALAACPLEDGVRLEELADRLSGCSGADVTEFCERVKMTLIRKEIENAAVAEVTKTDVDGLLSKTKSSVLGRDVESMNRFLGSGYFATNAK
ncbi:MAG: ATP-binding protein [Clostridiales bacterium]|jgi:transitional endoplasmic reticulum ATPase|nr:ATP-binding protein [Clostridiales bacterium]